MHNKFVQFFKCTNHSKSDLEDYKLSCQDNVRVEVVRRETAFDFAFLTGRSLVQSTASADEMRCGSSVPFLYSIISKR